jgi:predicted nucleotidyltransferase
MATGRVTDDPVLARVRKGLDAIYGAQLERVVLFGSRARGDAHADSDYDVAVFLHDMDDRFGELERLSDVSLDVLDETGEIVQAMAFRAGACNDDTALMSEIRKDGIDL